MLENYLPILIFLLVGAGLGGVLLWHPDATTEALAVELAGRHQGGVEPGEAARAR